MDDRWLTALFLERSDDAVAELSRVYGRIFLKQAMNVLNNQEDAEECVNDAYLHIWNSIPPAEPESLFAYGSRIVRNLSLNRLTREKAKKRPDIMTWQEEDPLEQLAASESVEEEVIRKEMESMIDSFLEKQSEQNQMLFVRRFWYVDSYEELARLSGLSQATLRTRLSRMKRELRKYLKERGAL